MLNALRPLCDVLQVNSHDLYDTSTHTSWFTLTTMPLKTSKLCKSFPEVMKDDSPLSILEYFIQYMESVNALHLVQFWLTVESFKLSVQSPKVEEQSPKQRPSTNSKVDSANMDKSSVCNDRTSCTPRTPVHSRGMPGNVNGAGSGEKVVDSRQRKVLQRRDTENHKYCNCNLGMHHQVTPPQSKRQPQDSQVAGVTDEHSDVVPCNNGCRCGPVGAVLESPGSAARHFDHMRTTQSPHSSNLS